VNVVILALILGDINNYMALVTRLAIHSASPKYAINSCCYVAQVKYNSGPEVLQVVFKDEGSPTPTNESEIINSILAHPNTIESIHNTSIDSMKHGLALIGTKNVETESI